MSSENPFRFDRDFASADLAASGVAWEPAGPCGTRKTAAAPPPPPPTFSAEELAEARSEAMAAGREAAVAELEAANATQQTAALESIAAQLANAVALRDGLAERLSGEAVAVAVAVTRKLFPAASRRFGLDEIAAVLEDAVAKATEAPALTVRVGGELRDAVADRLVALTEERAFRGIVSVVADPSIAVGDCCVEWSGGGAARDSEALWRDIDAAVERCFGPMAEPTAAPLAENEGAPPTDADDASPDEPEATSPDEPDKAPPEDPDGAPPAAPDQASEAVPASD